MPRLRGNRPLHHHNGQAFPARLWAGILQAPQLPVGVQRCLGAGECHVTDAGGGQLAPLRTGRPPRLPVLRVPLRRDVEMTALL